ncbi:ATPase domain-containing protein [Ktedonobacter racemifer]|uniref:KaiA binding protein n=1 Tax=Ktedonobacter racemifer DSM 44963 TaxID=485913 RepID=D6TXK7_KTERA|nr:ATPase domain-containing protein [Ktedonobacter racemifer]EFH84940.1 KaiA binding protein [Ktedonobacter racemifer DSM 44963]
MMDSFPSDATSVPMVPPPSPLEPTGIPHLDLVLGGGLPKGALTVILGPPGSGKTTLASQIAFAAAQRGEKVLFLTALSEPTTKLLEHLRSYSFFAPNLVGRTVQVFSLQQFFPPEGPITGKAIVAEVHRMKASVVVLDGFQGLRGQDTDFVAARRLLYDLGTQLSMLGTTSLVTAEADPRDTTLFPEMTTADVLIGLYNTLLGVRTHRALEVLKVRGKAALPGLHGLAINEIGVHVFPRLETRLRHPFKVGWNKKTLSATPAKRATFELPELDTLLGGGLTRQTGTVLIGSPGTGKTLLALQFLLAGVAEGEPGVYLGFRETADQLVQKSEDFAWSQQLQHALSARRGLTVHHWDPVELDPDHVATEVLAALEQIGARRLVIDSLAEWERAIQRSSGAERVPDYLAAFLSLLRERGVTLLAIKEPTQGIITQPDFSVNELTVLAENVVSMQHLIYQGKLHRILFVPKMRFSAHDETLRDFLITTPEGVRVLTPNEREQDILIKLAEQQAAIQRREPPPQRSSPSEQEQH